MHNILYKYGLLNIIPVEQLAFFSQKLPKKTKLNRELIELNYKKYSPYKNPIIYSIIIKEQVLVWFGAAQTSNAYVQIPQSYLIFKQLLKLKKDGIYLLKDIKNIQVFVIKDALLLNTFSINSFDSIFEKMIKQEYNLDTFTVFDTFKTKVYKEQAYKSIGIKELKCFFVYDFNRRTLFNKFIDLFWIPLSLIFLTFMVVNAAQGIYLEQKNKKIVLELELIKKQNDILKQDIQSNNRKIKNLNSFTVDEILEINPFYTINQLYVLLKGIENTTLKSLSISNNILLLQLHTEEESVQILQKLNKISFFEKVIFKGRNEGSTKYNKKILPVVLFEIELKSSKE